MEYSTTELMNITGYSSASITKILTQKGYNPVRIESKGLKIWQEEALDVILQRKEDVSRESEYVALPYLAHKYGISNQLVRDILSKLNIQPAFKNTKRMEFYDKGCDEILNQQVCGEQIVDSNLHPLVTDTRWLKLSNWPNIVPKCFEDLDEDIA